VVEWSSFPGTSNFAAGGPVKSLALPVEDAPYVPLDTDFSQWVCVDDFGAVAGDKGDDTEAVRKAIDFAVKNNKSTLCFRHGQYNLAGRITIGGSIRRVQGAYSTLNAGKETLDIVVEEGSAPVVLFDLVERAMGPTMVVRLENASSRTVVVRNFRAFLIASGPGRTFLEDSCARVFITNPKARVWVRQLNSEGQAMRTDLKNENKGGTLWALGVKTEGVMSVLATSDGGYSELLGAWIYVIGKEAPPGPLFIVKDATASFAGIIQWHFQGKVYPVLVDETQGAEHRQLTKQTNNNRDGILLFRSK
jgi:hypothetical protein